MMTNIVLSSSLTIAVAVIYTLIFIQYKLIQRRMGAAMHNRRAATNVNSNAAGAGADPDRQSKKEAALMLQFGLISLVLLLYIGTFWFVTLVWTNRYGEMFLNFFVSLNSCVSPVLYLSFGSEFRGRLPWKTKVNTVVTMGAASVAVNAISANRRGSMAGMTQVTRGY